jgi:hypothetical protein
VTSVLSGGEQSSSRPSRFTPGDWWTPEPVWTRYPRENLCSCRESNHGCPVCSLVTILTELPGS